jgi:PKD repeat protein/C1A family cysteine protease
MKKMNSSLTFLFLLLFTCSPFLSFAQKTVRDTDPHKTGLIRKSARELAEEARTRPHVTKVYLNKIGLERINKQRISTQQAPLNIKTRPVGLDFETAVGPDIQARPATMTPGLQAPGAPPNSTSLFQTGEFLPETLPKSVDNTTLKYFPPIRSQGQIGSCGIFSAVYYTMTHMHAMANDLNAKTGGDTYRLSPKWVYNMVNGGSDSGSWPYWAYDMGIQNGIATWNEFPYDSNYLEWKLDAQTWKNAINRRFDQTGYISSVNTTTGLTNLKQMLANGYLLNFATFIYSWNWTTIKKDPSSSAADAYVGKPIVYASSGQSGYHAMTIVGYNDDIWTDINMNNIVDPGEKGALRIANSWGTDWNGSEAGFCWMSYAAVSQGGFYPTVAWWVTARASYTPTLLAEFKVNHASRQQLRMALGRSTTARTTPTTSWASYALNYSGGPLSFNGTGTAVDGTFALDFSDIAVTGINQRYYLTMQDNASGSPSTLKTFRLIDVQNGTTKAATGLPTSADGQTANVYIDYLLGSANTSPVAEISANPTSGTRPLAVTFSSAGSRDPDGTITAYAWDFGDNTSATGANANHTYTSAGTFTARLTVTDNQGATGFDTTTITVSNVNTPPVAAVSASPTSGTKPLAVSFSGSGSSDPDGTITSYAWDFGDSSQATGVSASHTYTNGGIFNARLTVTDNNNATDSTTVAINVNIPPVAQASATPSSGLIPLTVSFSGSGSNDPDGTITAYNWDFRDGTTGTGSAVSHTFTQAGNYNAELVVTDNSGASTLTSVSVSALSNQAPTPVISATPTSGATPLEVSFSGAASQDPDGTITSYAWDFGDGTTASGVSAVHTYTDAGTFTARLTVTDNHGSSASTTVTITTAHNNAPPTPVASATPTSGTAPLSVSFSGINSSDADGSIATYSWDFGDGSTGSGATADHTYTDTGVFPAELTVTDNQGASASTTINITVIHNAPPLAVITASPTAGLIPLDVTFSGNGSSDSDGTITSYSWNFGDNTTATGIQASHTYTKAGTFTARLTVTDNKGATASKTVTIKPSKTNLRPVASVSASPTSGTTPLNVIFSGEGSYDPDGTIAVYNWSFGDGKKGQGPSVSHTYTRKGKKIARLIVIDNNGLMATKTVTIDVN